MKPTRIERDARTVVLHDVADEASFTLLRNGEATVAVPLNARALALTNVRGRHACFLPLNDEIGVTLDSASR